MICFQPFPQTPGRVQVIEVANALRIEITDVAPGFYSLKAFDIRTGQTEIPFTACKRASFFEVITVLPLLLQLEHDLERIDYKKQVADSLPMN